MTRYVDPNSGAAPQPGGWAGAEGAAYGHALPGFDTEVEQKGQLNEVLEVDQSVESEPLDEQKAVNDASIEKQAIDPSESEGESDDESEKMDEQKAVKDASVEKSATDPSPKKTADSPKKAAAPAKKAPSKK